MGRRTGRTKKKDDLFFMYLASTGNVTKACEESGYSTTRVYEYRVTDIDFKERWQTALDSCAGLVEGSLIDVLVNGDTDYKVLNFTDNEGKKHSVVKKVKKRYPASMLAYMKIRDSDRYGLKPVMGSAEYCESLTDEQLDAEIERYIEIFSG